MADNAAVLSRINGWAKDIFGDAEKVEPTKLCKFQERVKFDSKNKLGEKFSMPIFTSGEGGFSADGATTLQEADAAEAQEATITGVELTLKTIVSFKMLSSCAGSKESFGNYWARQALNMREATFKRRETALLYGGSPIGTLSAISGTGTSRVLTISEASWAPHIFLKTKNHRLDAYKSTTQQNDEAAIVITKVDIKNRQLTVSGDSDDLTSLDTDTTTVNLYWRTFYGADGTGLYTIGNATTGSYLGLDRATYPDVWQGTQVTVPGVPLDWTQIANGLEEAAGRGSVKDRTLLVNFASWHGLNTDLAALRALDSSYRVNRGDVGVKSIEFHSFGSTIEVVPSGFVKGEHAMAFPSMEDSDISLKGSTDVTFMGPGGRGEMFVMVPGTNYYEARCYSDVALWISTPTDVIAWSGIDN